MSATTNTVKHTPAYGFYYIPRSPLNPHGTYAIVAVEDLAVEPAGRHHLAEVSGFGDGSPSARKVPDVVHLFCAAPDLLEALKEAAERLRYSGDHFHDIGAQTRAEADWAASDAAFAAISKATGSPAPQEKGRG